MVFYIMILIKTFFSTLSFLAPRAAGKQAVSFFQKPFNKKLRPREIKFFDETSSISIPSDSEDVQAFDIGPKSGQLVIMVHGWESNAGSMSAIGSRLATDGYRVISFNLPGHGFSKLKKTNLKLAEEALLAVIKHLNPTEPFHIIGHSFGSAVSTYTLSKTDYEVNQMILLTTPNRTIDPFYEFGSFIGLNDKSQESLNREASKIMGEPIENIKVENLIKQVSYKQLTIIHDTQDKIISVEKARKVHDHASDSKLIEIQNKGHYRMLWDEEVINLVSNTLILGQPISETATSDI